MMSILSSFFEFENNILSASKLLHHFYIIFVGCLGVFRGAAQKREEKTKSLETTEIPVFSRLLRLVDDNGFAFLRKSHAG